jgi:hypothetical protein
MLGELAKHQPYTNNISVQYMVLSTLCIDTSEWNDELLDVEPDHTRSNFLKLLLYEKNTDLMDLFKRIEREDRVPIHETFVMDFAKGNEDRRRIHELWMHAHENREGILSGEDTKSYVQTRWDDDEEHEKGPRMKKRITDSFSPEQEVHAWHDWGKTDYLRREYEASSKGNPCCMSPRDRILWAIFAYSMEKISQEVPHVWKMYYNLLKDQYHPTKVISQLYAQSDPLGRVIWELWFDAANQTRLAVYKVEEFVDQNKARNIDPPRDHKRGTQRGENHILY